MGNISSKSNPPDASELNSMATQIATRANSINYVDLMHDPLYCRNLTILHGDTLRQHLDDKKVTPQDVLSLLEQRSQSNRGYFVVNNNRIEYATFVPNLKSPFNASAFACIETAKFYVKFMRLFAVILSSLGTTMDDNVAELWDSPNVIQNSILHSRPTYHPDIKQSVLDELDTATLRDAPTAHNAQTEPEPSQEKPAYNPRLITGGDEPSDIPKETTSAESLPSNISQRAGYLAGRLDSLVGGHDNQTLEQFYIIQNDRGTRGYEHKFDMQTVTIQNDFCNDNGNANQRLSLKSIRPFDLLDSLYYDGWSKHQPTMSQDAQTQYTRDVTALNKTFGSITHNSPSRISDIYLSTIPELLRNNHICSTKQSITLRPADSEHTVDFLNAVAKLADMHDSIRSELSDILQHLVSTKDVVDPNTNIAIDKVYNINPSLTTESLDKFTQRIRNGIIKSFVQYEAQYVQTIRHFKNMPGVATSATDKAPPQTVKKGGMNIDEILTNHLVKNHSLGTR